MPKIEVELTQPEYEALQRVVKEWDTTANNLIVDSISDTLIENDDILCEESIRKIREVFGSEKKTRA